MPKRYTMEDKYRAVAAYVRGGSLEKAAETSGIPRKTISDWRKRDPEWWEHAVNEAWKVIDPEIQAKMVEVIKEGLEEALDRIRNGDHKLFANGQTGRVPVSARDLNTLIGTMNDKVNVARGKPTSITKAATVATADRLKELKSIVAESDNVVPIQRAQGGS